MIVECPECQASLRLNQDRYAGKRLSLRCPSCQQNFNVSVPVNSRASVLVAHGDSKTFDELRAVLVQDELVILTCDGIEEALNLLQHNPVRIVLVDVALAGSFPFELIEAARNKRAQDPVKVILLPSVYNKTAYKRRPTSLYGADAYLELHHIGDRLLPLLRELCPDLGLKEPTAGFYRSAQGEERSLADAEGDQQATELARLLIADIALYHQEQIEKGIREGDPERYLDAEMAEGRRLLAEQIDPDILAGKDYLGLALRRFVTDRPQGPVL